MSMLVLVFEVIVCHLFWQRRWVYHQDTTKPEAEKRHILKQVKYDWDKIHAQWTCISSAGFDHPVQHARRASPVKKCCLLMRYCSLYAWKIVSFEDVLFFFCLPSISYLIYLYATPVLLTFSNLFTKLHTINSYDAQSIENLPYN